MARSDDRLNELLYLLINYRHSLDPEGRGSQRSEATKMIMRLVDRGWIAAHHTESIDDRPRLQLTEEGEIIVGEVLEQFYRLC